MSLTTLGIISLVQLMREDKKRGYPLTISEREYARRKIAADNGGDNNKVVATS